MAPITLTIYQEPPGVLAPGPDWVALDDGGYLYLAETLEGLLRQLSEQWRDDRYLVG